MGTPLLIKKASHLAPILFALLALAMTSSSTSAEQINADSSASSPMKTYSYRIINSYPHDPDAFTQGLAYDRGMLYEGTGLYGQSSLRLVDIQTGKVLKLVRLEDEFFAEGIAIWEDRIVQLTWQSHQGFVWDKENLTVMDNFTYQTEGWGLTSDGERLIMSDGSDSLYFLDPEDYSLQGSIRVSASGEPIKGLNELEYINGMIYANLWPSSWIAIISPETGEVTGKLNLSGILDESGMQEKRVDVLNGIAYDASGDRLFVTGKLWPRLFEIELVEDAEESNQQSEQIS